MMKNLPLVLFLSGMIVPASAEAVKTTPQGKVMQTANTADTSYTEEEDQDFDEETNDPLEPLNRTVYFVNSVLDAFILKPAAIAYRLILPEEIRNGVGNALRNLAAPITTLNHLLQGQGSRAGVTLVRFGLNSTVGVLGLVDVAKEMGFHTLETNFNETMAVWGVNTGPYLVLPIIGPSTFRGTLGLGVDYFTQPLNYFVNKDHHNQGIGYAILGTEVVHQRNLVLEAIDDLEATSLDMYASLRSVHFQKQTYQLTKLQEADESKSDNELLDAPKELEIFG